MYDLLHRRRGHVPPHTVDAILGELRARLDPTGNDTLLPKVGYARIAFDASRRTEWSSPWGQAFSLLRGLATFTRATLANRHFVRDPGPKTLALLHAMNVADDHLLTLDIDETTANRAAGELGLIEQLAAMPHDTDQTTRALWALITTGDDHVANELLEQIPRCSRRENGAGKYSATGEARIGY
jgi:hypothetical protein